MIENIYLTIIIIGSTSLLVVYYYNRRLKSLLHVLYNLLELQATRATNIESYIDSIQETLEPIGIEKIVYDIRYLRNRITSKMIVVSSETAISKDIYYKNISGTLSIVTQNNRGENRLINKLILYVITLQIVNSIHTEIEKINESFERIAKLQTYMMHDLKNILQFFQAMQYNVEHLQTQEERIEFIEFLQNSTEPINTKVNKILEILKVQTTVIVDDNKEILNVKEHIEYFLQLYNLDSTIVGDIQVLISREHLTIILENIFTNIYQKSKEDTLKCFISLKEDAQNSVIEIKDSGKAFQEPNKVLEPFYTTKGEGLGIGMFQVANVVESNGGSITSLNKEGMATTIITLPNM